MSEESTTPDLGLSVQLTNYTGIDDVRASAERLARERG